MNENGEQQATGASQLITEAQDQYGDYVQIINDLNDSFHHNYSQVIERSHASLGRKETPVIVVSGDHVILFHDGREETVSIVPRLYQEVKSISHLSFGIYVILSTRGYGPVPEPLLAQLSAQLGLIEDGLAALDKLAIPEPFIALQYRTLSAAQAVVQDVLQSGTINEAHLQAFGAVSAPLYMENAALAARLELDALHEIVGRWRAQIDAADWANLYVVICAAHQARYRETTKQYFQCLLHEKESLDANTEYRIIYAEHIYDKDAALLLLARHLIDQKISLTLFNNRTRLQEDLMSDGAADYLKILFGEQAESS